MFIKDGMHRGAYPTGLKFQAPALFRKEGAAAAAGVFSGLSQTLWVCHLGSPFGRAVGGNAD